MITRKKSIKNIVDQLFIEDVNTPSDETKIATVRRLEDNSYFSDQDISDLFKLESELNLKLGRLSPNLGEFVQERLSNTIKAKLQWIGFKPIDEELKKTLIFYDPELDDDEKDSFTPENE